MASDHRTPYLLPRLLASSTVMAGCAGVLSWDGFAGGDADAGASGKDADATSHDGREDTDGPPDASGGKPPISFVQVAATAEGTTVATVVVPFKEPQRAGDLNVVAVGWEDEATPVVQSVTDTSGNAYVLAIKMVTPSVAQHVYFAPNIAAATQNVITVKWDKAAPYADVRAAEYAGLDTKSPLDQAVSNAGESKTSTTGIVTTKFPDELLFAAATGNNGFTGGGEGFSLRIIAQDGNLVADRIVHAIGSYSTTASMTDSAPWVMQLVTFH